MMIETQNPKIEHDAEQITAGLEVLKGTSFEEVAPLYSTELREILQAICDNTDHPIIEMREALDKHGNPIEDDEGNVLKLPTPNDENLLYHINRVWNPFYYGGLFYIYDPVMKYHRPDSDDVTRNLMACLMVRGQKIKPGRINGLLQQIVNHTASYPFGNHAGTLNFVNGVFDTRTGKMLPHTKSNFYDYVIFTEYREFEETQELYSFLDQYGNREVIAVLAKALWQRCFIDTLKEFTVFYGDRDSGKTTAAELIQATLDGDLKKKYNTSRILLQELLMRFGLASLEHKTVNIGDDLPDMFVKNTGKINELVGSVNHEVERKGIDHFATTITAYNLFTTNNLPPLDDDDLVIWSKIRLVEFKNKFSRGTVREPLYTETIKQQFLYRAVELMRSWKDTPYVNDQTPDDVRAKWNEASTSTDSFMAECLMPDWSSFTPLTEIERVYDSWCRDNHKRRYIKHLRKTLKPGFVRRASANGYAFRITYKPDQSPKADPAQTVIG